ncbi:acetate--CoA ligase family protein [Patescibacteria group bacterium]|nr:acetate--CoA ligase family protein [Patescibacteria group bacterium]
MPSNLEDFFCPKSVAVVGASSNTQKIGHIVLKNIAESNFKGNVYPVNPSSESILNLKCYKNVSEIAEIPDLAVLAVPASAVNGVLKEIGEKGIKNVVVLAAGFKEIGEAGLELENELVEISKKYDLNVLGPNCLGFVNNKCSLNTTFSDIYEKTGNLRFISQSGALASSIFDWCETNGIGYSEFITLGNKAVLSENDALEYFMRAPDKNNAVSSSDTEFDGLSSVSPIGMYLESITDGEKFLQICSEISNRDPILLLKPGKTRESSTAMQSHTGSIAGEDAVMDVVVKQAGVFRCDTLEDLFDLSKAFAWENLPEGPNVHIISNAGGPAVISTDAAVLEGLQLPELSDETRNKLAEILPRTANIVNPVDVLGDALADRYLKAAEVILETDKVDALIFILTPQLMTQIEQTAEYIGNLSAEYKKPIFCSFIGGSHVNKGEEILNKHKIPNFRYPERAVKAISSMWRFRQMQIEKQKISISEAFEIEADDTRMKKIVNEALSKKVKALDAIASNNISVSLGLLTPPTSIVNTFEEALEFSKINGWPMVLKLSSNQIVHKKELGGVIVDIMNEAQLESSWDKLQKRIEEFDENIKSGIKIQIQKEILNGIEVIVGFKRDPVFGSVLLFGAGGSLAELIVDRNLHLLPIDIPTAKKLVENSKVYTLLKGYRGSPPYELNELCELIVKVSKLSEMIPEAESIEINPVIVTLDTVWAVDTKVILKEGEHAQKAKKPQFLTAKTSRHAVLATTYHSYDFIPDEPFEFNPGQYISVKVAENTIRCYSVASHVDTKQFSLLVDTKPGGPGSKFFENLKVNDKITFLGPFGVFTYKPEDDAETLLFLGTGSGVSPLRCMIESALKEHKFKGTIHLYIGLNFVEDIFWTDYLDSLKNEYPNFKYDIAVFKPNEGWKGHQGFITDLVKKDYKDASKVSAYLCGNKYMVKDATDVLIANGCPEERIYTEKFV